MDECKENKEIIEALRAENPATLGIFFKFCDCLVEARCSEPLLVKRLETYFRPFVVDSSPSPDISITLHESATPVFFRPFVVKKAERGKTKVKEEYCDLPDGRIIRKRLTGMSFLLGAGECAAVGPCLANLNQVVNFINHNIISWTMRKGFLLCHAAAVEKNGRGLAIAGFSGTGKSTLALHLLSEGSFFVSNDRIMARRDDSKCLMRGVAKLPRINPGTAIHNPDLASILPTEEHDSLQRLSPSELWSIEDKYDVDIARCFGPSRFRLEASLDGFVILNWVREKIPFEIYSVGDLASRQDLLSLVMKGGGLFCLPRKGKPSRPAPADYVACLRGVQVVEFRGGVNFPEATRHCVGFLESGTFRFVTA